MNELEKARLDIDETDREMATLFIRRMQAAETVAEYKKNNGLPVEDKAREAELTARRVRLIPEKYRPYYLGFLEKLIEESKNYQNLLIGGMTVAYSGVEGAFAHIAAKKIFPSAKAVPCPDFDTAYLSVEQGKCNCAVLPIENSFAGDVGQVMDIAYRGNLSVSGIYDMPLSQSLLAKPDTEIEDISAVVSHPQALSQCMPYLKKHGWELIHAINTAAAAKTVAEGDRKDIAVAAAKEAAEIYGLKILEEEINESKSNTTRFAVFTAESCRIKPGDRHFAIMFSSKNQPGALSRAISLIGKYGYNLKCLKSHPTGQENWEYYFYAEGEGNLGTEAGQKMLSELEKVCNSVRILGSFPEEIFLGTVRNRS